MQTFCCHSLFNSHGDTFFHVSACLKWCVSDYYLANNHVDDVLRVIDGITSFPRPLPSLERLFAVGADSPVRGRGRVQTAADFLVDGVYRLPSLKRSGSSRYVAIAMVTFFDGTAITVQRAGDGAKVATQAEAYEDEDIQICWLDQQLHDRPLLDERKRPVRRRHWVILQRSSRLLNTPIYDIRLSDHGQSLRLAVERKRSKPKRFQS